MPWLSSVLPLIVTLIAVPASSGPGAHEPAAADVEPATASPARLQRGYLRVEGVDRSALVDALALRVPHLAFEPFEAAAGAELGQGVAFVELRRSTEPASPDEAAFALTIVVSDGRAFDRRVLVGQDDHETVRLLASTVANLLLAIEAGSVAADRGDVPLPAPVVPATVCDCECPVVPACPGVPTPDAPSVTPRGARLEIGPAVTVVTVLGLGEPVAADRFAAAGASVGVHGRLRSGAFFGAELRTSGRGEASGRHLVRQRFAIGAGYQLRRGAWSLDASLWGTAEPWWFVGAPVDPTPTPLWGVLARLAPSLHQARIGGRRLGLTVGPVLELGASAELTGGAARIGLVVVDDGRAVVSRSRVGGLELATGLSATLWFDLPR